MVLNRFERLDQFIYKTDGARLSVCLSCIGACCDKIESLKTSESI